MSRKRRPAAPAAFPQTRGNSEASSEQTIRDLREAVRAREDFLAIAAHELRNPITPLMFSAQLLRNALQKRDFARAEDIVNRLERLLEQFLRRTEVILDVTRITSHQLKLTIAPIDLSRLVHGAVESLRPMLNRTGSTLTATIEDGVICLADQVAAGQIVENVLSNAAKYGNGQPITVSVSAEHGWGCVMIRDSGIGIAKDEQERIFQRFERAMSASGHAGFGLGLWISRNLLEEMGGSITVTSEKGVGSQFEIKVPLQEHKDPDE